MRGFYVRFIVISVLLTAALATLSLLFMNRLSAITSTKDRDRFLIFFAEDIERQIGGATDLSQVENPLAWRPLPPPSGPPPTGGRLGPPPAPPGGSGLARPPGMRGPRPAFWIVEEDGKVVFFNREPTLDKAWAELPRPQSVHVVEESADFLRLEHATQVVRLDFSRPLYLVARDPDRPSFLELFGTQAVLLFITVTFGFAVSALFLFYYLRRKSIEAREVLRRLGQGDLKARFQIKKFDEFGGLILDFNLMADQIERLIGRIHETETARKNLVQELGHDLRTPLTSLRTATETLKTLDDKISPEARRELVTLIEEETSYFGRLLENLMTIASLDEPNFKSTTSAVEIGPLLGELIQRRRGSRRLAWELETPARTDLTVLGDAHLLERLFANALTNSERFARSKVKITVEEKDAAIDIHVDDDGPGLGQTQIDEFGTRRKFQNRRANETAHASLGLGSVIMKSIAELHAGHIAISNRLEGGEIGGARLTIRLPAYRP